MSQGPRVPMTTRGGRIDVLPSLTAEPALRTRVQWEIFVFSVDVGVDARNLESYKLIPETFSSLRCQ